MSHNDAASITLNLTLPQGVIKEYFEGMAKVETAKHPPGGGKSSFDMTSLLGLAPLLIPLLSGCSKQGDSCPIRVPESKPEIKEKTMGQCPNADNSCELKPDVVISFSTAGAQKHSDENKEGHAHKTSDISKSDSKESTGKSEKKEVIEKVEVSENEVSDSVKSQKDPAKPKRPIYQDGDQVILDINNLTGTFGGLTDMMKVFGPMMGEFVENMNVPKSVESKLSTSVSEVMTKTEEPQETSECVKTC